MRKRTTIIWAVAAAAMLSTPALALPSTAQKLSCESSTTLEELIDCIYSHAPIRYSEGYVMPTDEEMDDFGEAVNEMMSGNCDFEMPWHLFGIMERREFVDFENNRHYCVLMEVRDIDGDDYVDRGWGTFITYENAVRQLNITAPHIIFDMYTHVQAIEVFKETGARSFHLAGAHRWANENALNECQSAYGQADAAHNDQNMLFASTVELLDYYGTRSWYQIQFHGKAQTTCSGADVVFADGVVGPPTPKVDSLWDRMDGLYGWDFEGPAYGYTCLQATYNVVGRLLNGVPEAYVCNSLTAAPTPSGKFVHIEAAPNYRDADDWIPAIETTWPASAHPGSATDLAE